MTKKGISLMLYSCLVMLLAVSPVKAQHLLYPTHFDLSEVTLLDSPFKQAQDRNYQVLLYYNVDRMLTPYVRQAGLSDAPGKYNGWVEKNKPYTNWAWQPDMAMDGHVTGHYLSALSMSYASCRDENMRGQLKERIDHIVDVLADCQAVFDNDNSGLKGFIGGVPDNEIWKALYSGDYRVYNQRGNWAPLYCEHKVLAGLRDAYVHAGNAKALEVFHKMADWIIEIVHNFKDADMEMQILQWEPGGVNEVLADAYKLFGDGKYIRAANKYSHQIIVENVLRDGPNRGFLDLKNVNETSAKFVGYARISELKHEDRYDRAVNVFWDEAVNHRMTAIGGTGVNGTFQPVNKSTRYISELNGPDACSTYNLLKLTERLFDRSHNAHYVDYYEGALINHILGNQDPESGGYVFHTSLRPNTYRIYSQPNVAMWCCVGTGMESQSKHGDFIYTVHDDTLFVNLFIASELTNEKYALTQETKFPFGEKSKITINKPGNYVIAVRRPSWTNQEFDVKVNGKQPKNFKPFMKDETSYYVSCGKGWKQGDVIEIKYPMSFSYEECPRVPTYIALKYGPVVLAGVTEKSTRKESFEHEYAGAGRRDHSNADNQPIPSLANAPMLITERAQIPTRINVVDLSNLEFEVNASAPGSAFSEVEVRPLFKTHHNKYTVYWNQQTESAWLRNPLYLREKEAQLLAKLTMDAVEVGEPSSEDAHNIQVGEAHNSGKLNGNTFRSCQPGDWFQYDLSLKENVPLAKSDSVTLQLRFSLLDRGRKGAIYLNNKLVRAIVIPAKVSNATKDRFFDYAITVSAENIVGKKTIPVRFVAPDGAFPRLYGLKFYKKE